jgi:hypothetical protein
VYYSANCILLLPGEERVVTLSLPNGDDVGGMRLEMRRWNVKPTSTDLPKRWV